MQREQKSTTTRVSSTSTVTPNRRGSLERKAPESAFTLSFLERSRTRSDLGEVPTARQAVFAGPWDVEEAHRGDDRLQAVVRREEPRAEGGGSIAVFRHRSTAFQAAAAMTAAATPCQLHLNTEKPPGRRSRLGFPILDGATYVGHLSRPEPSLLHYLHATRCLAASPEAAALWIASLDPETLALLGRAIMRRLR